LLISNGFIFCCFFGQANKGLDFQGLARAIDGLSTKLSTEKLDDSQNCDESMT